MTLHHAVKLCTAVAVLAFCGWLLASQLVLRSDLGFFMPRTGSPTIDLLSAKLQEGPASSLILLALSGESPERLARSSDRLAQAIEDSGQFRFVANGRFRAPAHVIDVLFRHRYVVDPEITPADFSAAALRRDLRNRLRELGTTSGMAMASTLPADPTNRMMTIAQHWKGGTGSVRRHGVWFSRDGTRALLVSQTIASGLDFAAQRVAQDIISSAADEIAKDGTIRLEMSGPAVFASEASRQIRRDMIVLTIASAVLVVTLLLVAFRSLPAVLALALPLSAGVLAAIAAVQLIFGEIHAVSLTFGITLIGVAVDYPVHLAAHASESTPPAVAVQRIWPTLRLGALTTVAGFIPIVFSSFPGLSQMGVFAIVGLLTAAATTRWIVPALVPGTRQTGWWLHEPAWFNGLDRLRILRPGVILFFAAAAAYLAFGPDEAFDDDLGRLSPVPAAAKALDRELRLAAEAPDVRYLVLMEGASPEAVLQRSEQLEATLDGMVRDGTLSGYDMASKYLPSMQSQKRRRAALPDAATLRNAMAKAQSGLPFREGTFEPFLDDVAAARTAPPVTFQDFRETGLGWLVEPLLSRLGGRWVGLVAPAGLSEPEKLASHIARQDDPSIRFFDLKRETDQLVRNYRQEALLLLGWGALALLLVLALGLRSLKSLLRVGAPIGVSVLSTAGALVLLGEGLSLFHLLSLLLVTGVGLDYALFFNRYTGSSQGRANTLRAIILCGATTFCVFAVLATSGTPVLRGIGLTVSLGTALSLLLTPVFATRPRTTET